MARHRARRQALQLLFQWDQRRTSPEEILSGYYGSLLVSEEDSGNPPVHDAFAETILRGVMNDIARIDELLAKHAEHWKVARMPAVDRNILRIAVWEMISGDTPAPVVIDEALELARQFSGEEAVHFVNGVLDAVRKSQTLAPETNSLPAI